MKRLLPFAAPVCGVFLVWYALAKISDPVNFLKAVHAYGVLPEQPILLLNLTASLLPWIELFGGVALISGTMRKGAALLSAVLILVFTFAVIGRIPSEMAAQGVDFFSLKFDCGCGTGIVVAWEKLITNAALIGGLLIAFQASRD